MALGETNVATEDRPKQRSRAGGIGLLSFVPFVVFVAAYFLAPKFAEDKHLTTLIFVGIYVLLALGLNLLMGYAGQVSLGHAAFFGLGAYSSAILTSKPVPQEVVPGLSLGIGVLTGLMVFVSLTKAAGARLAVGIAALAILAAVAGRLHLGLPLSVVVFAVGMCVVALPIRLPWWKSAIAGAVAGLTWHVCGWFLVGALKHAPSPWVAMAIGVFITSVIAYLIGSQVLRLRGHYLAMATLGFGIIAFKVFQQWADLFGPSDGISGIAPILTAARAMKPSVAHTAELRMHYFLVWAFVFVAIVLATNIVRSRVGRAFRAVHGSESAAESLGVDTERYKVQVFVLSAALASVAGSLYAHNPAMGLVQPGAFNFVESVELVAMVVVGGMASVWGALLGATAIQLLKDVLQRVGALQVGDLNLTGLEPVVFGSILIIVMIVMPQGIVRGSMDSLSALLRTARRGAERKAG